MAQGTAHQGAWEGIAHQGAWELQSHEYQDTLADSITLSDALAAGVSVPLADSVILSDVGFPVHARLNGSDQYFYRTHADFPESAITGDFTVEVWLKPDTVSGQERFVSKYDFGANARMYEVMRLGTEIKVIISSNGIASHSQTTSGLGLEIGKWQHIVAVYDASAGTVDVYKNGNFAQKLTGYPNTMTVKNAPFVVGASYVGSQCWEGGVSNLALFDRVRTSAEIQTAHANPNQSFAGDANLVGQWMFDEDAAATYIDNLQGDAGRDLIPYRSGNTTFGNCGRTTEDFAGLVLAAGSVLADTISGADSLQADASTFLADTISLSDLLAAGTQFFLADSITLTDALISAASRTLADNMSISEQLAAKAIIALADGISLADALTEIKPHITLSDTISLIDAIQQAAGTGLADTINLSDAIQAYVDEELDDGIGMADSLTGVLIPGVVPGPVSVVSAGTLSSSRSPSTWRMAVGSTPRPITYISQTSENTTYTKTSVSDSDAWDLTGVSRADIVITGDGFQGRIESVGVNSIIVDGWWKGGANLDGRAESIPADGQGATVHHSMQAKRVLIRAGKGNTNYIYAGMTRTVDVDSGHPISSNYSQPNSALRLEAPLDRWLNMCNVWLMANSNQEAVITPKAFHQVGMGGVVDLGPDHPIFNDCVLDGNFLYVAIEDVSEGGGVLVYNVADPTNPVRMNYLSVTNSQAEAPMRIIRHSGHLYSAWETGVRVIRAPSPSGMSQIADITRPAASGWPPTCAAYGDRLWCQGLNAGLGVYNISDPASPAHVGGVAHGYKHFGPEVGGVPPSTKHPYYNYPYAGYGAVFQTYQWVYATAVGVFCATMGPYWQFTLSDVPVLVHVHSCAIGPHGGSTPIAHAALGDVLYSHNAMGPLDPDYGYMRIAANAVLGHGDIGVITAPIEHYGKFVVSGGIGYIVTNGRIAIVNLATGILQSFISGTYRGADVGGNYLYATQYEIVMGSPNHHIDVYDISNPASPVLVGTGT